MFKFEIRLYVMPILRWNGDQQLQSKKPSLRSDKQRVAVRLGCGRSRKEVGRLIIVRWLFYFLCSIIILLALVVVILAAIWLIDSMIYEMTGIDLLKKVFHDDISGL